MSNAEHLLCKGEESLSPILRAGLFIKGTDYVELELPMPRRELDILLTEAGALTLHPGERRLQGIESPFEALARLEARTPLDLLHLNHMAHACQGLTLRELREMEDMMTAFDLSTPEDADYLASSFHRARRYPADRGMEEMEREHVKEFERGAVVGDEYIVLPSWTPRYWEDLLYLPDPEQELCACTMEVWSIDPLLVGAAAIKLPAMAPTVSHALGILSAQDFHQPELSVFCRSNIYRTALDGLETKDMGRLFFYLQKLDAFRDDPAFVSEMERRGGQIGAPEDDLADAAEQMPSKHFLPMFREHRLRQLYDAVNDCIQSREEWRARHTLKPTGRPLDMVMQGRDPSRAVTLRLPAETETLEEKARELGLESWEAGGFSLRCHGFNEYSGALKAFGRQPDMAKLNLLAYQLECLHENPRMLFLEEAAVGNMGPDDLLVRLGALCDQEYDPGRVPALTEECRRLLDAIEDMEMEGIAR